MNCYLTPLLSVEQTQSKAPDSVSQWQDPSFHPRSIQVPLQAVLPAIAQVKSRRHLWWVSFSSNGIAKIRYIMFQGGIHKLSYMWYIDYIFMLHTYQMYKSPLATISIHHTSTFWYQFNLMRMVTISTQFWNQKFTQL